MDRVTILPLTDTGTPALLEGEVVRRMQTKVSLYHQAAKTDYKDGTAYITTHRILWIDSKRRRPVYWNLNQVTKTEAHAGFMMRSPKIDVHLGPLAAGAGTGAGGSAATYFRLSFHKGGKDECYEQLEASLKKKAWVKPVVERKSQEFNTRHAGIGGILAREKQRQARTQKLTADAFGDIEALAANATKVVAIAERYAATRSAATDDDGEKNQFGSVLQNAGITSPVTRAGAGNMYHNELARQIAHFLREPLRQFGDMLLLTDIYCMYNRARGTDLVSPDDLLAACRLFEPLRLRMRLRTFPSGVMVVQSDNHNPEEVRKRILALLGTRDYVDGAFLATTWKVSLPVAQEHLLAAEQAGALCRDDSVQGLRFYINRFK